MSGWGAIYNNTTNALRLQTNLLANLQQQVSTGARILRPSDSPVECSRIIDLKNESLTSKTYLDNINTVVSDLEMSSTVLQEVSDSLSRARVILTQLASGTYAKSNRQAAADEVDALLEHMVYLANTKNVGRYIFSGSESSTTPYTVRRENGRIVSVSYQGGRHELNAPVGPGLHVSGLLIGEEVFSNYDRQPPVFLGNTGAAPAASTSSVVGTVWLTVAHGTTSYEGSSGIAAGTGSAANDTIIGDDHTLTINEPAGTISLDGGPTVSFDGTETNLKVTSSNGDVVFVDTTGVQAGFQGTVGISATGTLSIDGGKSTTTFAVSDSLPVTDSETGKVLFVDTSSLQRTGTEPVVVPGTYDVFETLIAIRDALQNNHDLPDPQLNAFIEHALDAVDASSAGVYRAMTAVGARMGAMESLRTSLENRLNQAETQISTLQDADIVQVATEITRAQTLYEMSLAAASKLLNLSLLDFIT